MRAREPDLQGYAERDGRKIGFESFGSGEVTVVFVAADTITTGRAWKGQVPFLARHFRVITIDPIGNGRSDRRLDAAAYSDLAYVADTVAVLDAAGVERAVVVGVCVSAWQALVLAALHPARVQGVVAIAPYAVDSTPTLEAAARFGGPVLRGAAEL